MSMRHKGVNSAMTLVRKTNSYGGEKREMMGWLDEIRHCCILCTWQQSRRHRWGRGDVSFPCPETNPTWLGKQPAIFEMCEADTNFDWSIGLWAINDLTWVGETNSQATFPLDLPGCFYPGIQFQTITGSSPVVRILEMSSLQIWSWGTGYAIIHFIGSLFFFQKNLLDTGRRREWIQWPTSPAGGFSFSSFSQFSERG